MTYTYEVSEEYKKILGKTLNELRNEKEMTVEEVCVCASTQEKICSPSQLRSYEGGRVMPDINTLEKLLAGMYMDSMAFFERVANYEMLHFERDFEEIWSLGLTKQYSKMPNLLRKLKTKPYCNCENPLIDQAVLLCEALIARYVKNDSEKCDDLSHSAISITNMTLVRTLRTDLEYAKGKIFSLNECRILKLMSMSEKRHIPYNQNSFLLETLRDTLLQKKLSAELVEKQLPNIYYNLSDAYIRSYDYEKAVTTCDTGMKYSIKHESFKMLPFLLLSKGEALYHLKEKESLIYFEQAKYAFELLGYGDVSDILFKAMNKEYKTVPVYN